MNRRLLLVPLLGALTGSADCGACASAEDRAAKERIFSPEDPPRVLQAASEALDAAALGGDAALAARVLHMPAQEAAARLGSHVQVAHVTFRWSQAGREVTLAEDRTVALGPGGDFLARTENDQGQGMEWIRVGGASFARSRFAPFRERRRDRGSSEHVQTSAYDALGAFYDLAHGALRLTSGGTTTLAGRTVVKYAVALGERHEPGAGKSLPEVVFPKGGPDKETKLRLTALETGVPTLVQGALYVDQQTAVPLKAELHAEIVVPTEGSESSKLDLTLTLDVSGIGKDPKIVAPEHLPDEPRPPGVVATLDAYGIPRATAEADGGTAAPADEPEPEEE